MEARKIRVGTFASQGPPHDKGVNYSHTLEPFVKEAFEGGAEEVFAWTPAILKEKLPDKAWSCQPYPEEFRIINAGYHDVGLGAWRFVMINEMMEKSNDGDAVVFYDRRHCNGVLLKNLKKYVEKVLDVIGKDGCEVFVPPYDNSCENVQSYTRKGVFDILLEGKTYEHREKIATAPCLRARLTVALVSPKTRDFFRKLEDICERHREKLLGGSPHEGFSPNYKFLNSCAEQSVLNIIGYDDGMFPLDWKGTWVEKCNYHGFEKETGYYQMMLI